MCGFAGIVAWEPKYRVDRAVLERMSARIAHRGPDGEGVWESSGSENAPYVGLVHRRLAIIDLDERANQPFTDGRGRWVVFNGEIYNYRELRRELEILLPDYAWKTSSDTEVLLAAYAAWGSDCLKRLNGMFAFAVWDGAKGGLFLARDRMGQKPLYVAWMQEDGTPASSLTHFFPPKMPSALAFASELAALRELPWFVGQTNLAALHNYLRWGHSVWYQTIYDGALHVLPAQPIAIRKPQFEIHPYWSGGGEADRDDDAARQRTRELVQQAVGRQLVADVPLGCFLSGGVDSSIIAAAMKQAAQGRVLTFSIGFDDPRYDESEYAARVAAHLGTEHHRFTVRPNAIDDLPKLAAVFGEPFADSSALPTHYLARETRKHVKVALSGDGGDELFGGYERYRALAIARRLASTPLGRVARAVAPILPGVHPKSRVSRFKRLVRSFELPEDRRYSSYLRLFDDATLEELIPVERRGGLKMDEDVVAARFGAIVSRCDPVIAARGTDLSIYLPCDILTKLDRSSMLHALEVRSPFMDHELVEFAATLTTKQLLKGGPKRMLREAFSDLLPSWVFKRKKMGFAVPIGEWFRGELRPMLRDHLFAADAFGRSHFNMQVVERLVDEHEREKVDHSQRLYALLMLELWWRTQ